MSGTQIRLLYVTYMVFEVQDKLVRCYKTDYKYSAKI